MSDFDNRELMKLSNLDEVKTVLFSIDSNTTLGPDGFGAGLLKKLLACYQNDISNSVIEFFTNGKILKEINHIFIALIPKVSNLA